MAAGPQMMALPTRGITEAGIITVPQKAGWGSPKIRKPTPPRNPWTKATITVPQRVALMVVSVSRRISVVMGSLQGRQLHQFGDEGVALEKHEEGDEQHQQQVKEKVGEALDQADGVGVDKGAGLGHHRLDDLRQIDLSRRQRQVQVDQVSLEGVDLGGNPGPDLAALHALGHLAGKFQGLGGDDAHQAEERDQDDQQENEAGEAGGQGPALPQQPAEAWYRGRAVKKSTRAMKMSSR